MKEWIKDLCPEIADWQAELIAEEAMKKRTAAGDVLMSREVMQQALEALEAIWEGGLENYPDTKHVQVMDDLRTALAEPEQKPLTDEAVLKLWGMRSDGPENREIIGFARAIEAAHGIK